MRSIVLATLLSLMGVAAHAQAIVPVDVATISMTAGLPRTVTDTICATDGNDLVCDRGAYITSSSRVGIGTNNPSSTLHVSGTVSIGSSNLGAQLLLDPSNTATLASVGTALRLGTATGNTFGILTNNSTRLLINANGQVAIGASFTPSTALQISGTLRFSNGGETCDSDRTGSIRYSGGDFSFCRNGSAWESLSTVASAADRIVSGTSAVVMNSATGIVSITQLGSVASYVHPSLGYVGPGVSATGNISATSVYAGNSMKLAGTGGSCASADDYGRMFRNATTGKLQLCMPRN